ncbi:hypothetical protein F5I97DRAFT_497878 [Phlebopus sp. FC_14]|nr:hypothetical protein F5I97DRAFT_497878 [Phlebopus sp. FC_14]
MRQPSQLLGRTRLLLHASARSRSRAVPPRLARTKLPKDAHPTNGDAPPTRSSSGVHKRLASSKPAPEEQQEQITALSSADSPPENDPPPSDPASDKDKPPRRSRTSTSGNQPSPKESDDRPQLPAGLDILWMPDPPSSNDPHTDTLTNSANAFPQPELFEQALTNLHIALHPQTQHRAAYASPTSPPVEPTIALYCPVEGGEYVLDETVRELARRTDAEVIVIDAVQLAAGEWGQFGKAASAIQLPRNPLHYYPIPLHPQSRRSPHPSSEQSAPDDPEPTYVPGVSQMTLHVLAPVAASRGRSPSVFAPSRTSPQPSRIKAFFDDLVNFPSSIPSPSSGQIHQRVRPRLIYIRDFPTLAPAAPVWYPHLLSAVRSRRIGPIARPTSPVACPMAIVCGITPPLVGPGDTIGPSSYYYPAGSAAASTPPNAKRKHTARPPSLPVINLTPSSSAGSSSTHQRTNYGEDDFSTRAREKRLRERLARWESRGDNALLDDVPRLYASPPSSPFGSASPGLGGGGGGMSPYGPPDAEAPRPIVLFGGSASPVLDLITSSQDGSGDSAEGSGSGRFFRASIVLPNVRDLDAEKRTRMERRREVNELAMRMGVGGVGGVLEDGGRFDIEGEAFAVAEDDTETVPEGEKTDESPFRELDMDPEIVVSSKEGSHEPPISQSSTPPSAHPRSGNDPPERDMWTDWSTRIEHWSSIRQIADRAVGSVVATQCISPSPCPTSSTSSAPTLEPTPVPWSAIHRAWASQKSSSDLRSTWTKGARVLSPNEQRVPSEDADEDYSPPDDSDFDDVVEMIKEDEDLDPHERRLLGCIVDPGTLSTTFAQVHLPQHTIDSVRTIVSLPLLYPAAFQTGILREHAMTGCLLFGPPGTGKTLVVRALAKEAGCRMLMISPSDVMDMYVGEGEKLVRAVFSLARRLSPCVVFLDEIDALFGARTSARETGGTIAHRGVITEFMQAMDGLKSQTGPADERVVIIGATNRPFDLDDAVLRRLPRRLLVDLPGETQREEILKILLRDETLSPEVDLKALAKRTETFSGSDLKHLCVSAVLDAVKEGVKVPWNPSPSDASTTATDASPPSASEGSSPSESLSRVIHPRHFTKALKEITPSSSETLGSLTDLRKWNDEFGEGRRDKRRVQVWGKGKFGFINGDGVSQEGHVHDPHSTRGTPSIEQ